MQRKSRGSKQQPIPRSYAILLGELTELVDEARRQSARAVNAALTATY